MQAAIQIVKFIRPGYPALQMIDLLNFDFNQKVKVYKIEQYNT